MSKLTNPNIVTTPLGALEGSAEDGLRVFRGVPFARPPVGELRFKSPRPLAPWDGVRQAKVAGLASYQMNLANAEQIFDEVKTIDPGVPGIPAWPGYVGKTYNQDNVGEDCLYLDMWVPEAKPDSKLPVYVYYHGGANAVSSGSFEVERGENLAKQEDIIIVRPNYRMGALGWVHFGLISDEFPEAINLGIQDQIAALKWVYDNIESFGGDKDNITIGGESAGATAVSHLMTNPDSRQYFKRAILQSLSPFNVWCTQQKEEAVVVAEKYIELLGIKNLSDLNDLDPTKFLAAQNVLTRFCDPDDNVAWRPLGGVIDGNWIREAPAQYLSQRNLGESQQALMIGFAKDEWQFFRGHSETIKNGTETQAIAVLAQIFGDARAKELFDGYSQLYPDHKRPGHVLSDIMSFEFFKFSSLAIAKNFASQGVPIHVFEFAYDLPGWDGDLRAVHTGDMPFLWRNLTEKDLQQWPGFDGTDREELKRVSDDMGKLYAAFIRNGEPGLTWKRFDEDTQTVLWFGTQVHTKERLLTAEWDLFVRHGAENVPALEDLLVKNLREKLKLRK